MDSDSTRADVEARLRETADAMSDRFASLQEEVSTTGTSFRDWIVENPLKSVGGMLAAGVAVGVLFGGRGSRRNEHPELLDQYVDALRAEVGEAVAEGDTPGEALEQALQGRAPLVVYRDGEAGAREAGSRKGFLRWGFGFVARLAARELIRDLVLSMLEEVDAGDVVEGEMFE